MPSIQSADPEARHGEPVSLSDGDARSAPTRPGALLGAVPPPPSSSGKVGVDRSARAHELLIAQVEEQLADGTLRPGDRLPSERLLVERLGISRASVREALRVLEAMGLVASRSGRGRGSGAVLTPTPASALAELVRLHVATSDVSMIDVVELRRVVEGWAVSIGLPATADQLAGLQTLVEAMDDEDIERADFVALDTRFHVALAELSGNALVAIVMGALREIIRGYAGQVTSRMGPWPAAAEPLRADHHAILDAVAAGSAQAAVVAVHHHIDTVYPELRVRR